MKIINLIVIAAFSLLMTSCFNTADEVWLNADGTGRFESTMDLSALYPFMMMGLEQQMNADSMDESDPGQAMIKNIFMGEGVDTLFDFGALMASSMGSEGMSKEDRLEMMAAELDSEGTMSESEKEAAMGIMANVMDMKMRMQVSKAESLFKTTTIQGFDNISDVSDFGKNLLTVMPYFAGQGESPLPVEQLGMVEQLFTGMVQMDISGSTLRVRRAGIDLSAFGEEVASAAGMMKMFLGDQPYRLIVHLPGKVKKISSDIATKVDAQTVAIEMPLDDLFDPDKSIDVKIQFKGLRK